MECPINGIIIPPNRRPLRNLEELAESIEQVGLLHPIIINENNRLLAGYHRLEACRSLGWADIPVHILRVDDIEEQLVEIDENLIRNELTILDRAEQLKRRKELYEELHPETRRGVAGGKASGASRRGEKRTSADNAFVQDTAEKTGRARRTIAEDVQ
ncbi:MAG: ParB N-terminal domain-containing protein, partial [Chloroflexi bacterium]|nr:ParB N-terminal domain-containing protein [Chloroflexota bacterium]